MGPQPATTYQLKITLNDSRPAIWRRLRVASDTMLFELHHILQITMGWEDAHLHEFICGKQRYGFPDEDFPSNLLDEFDYTLGQLLCREGDKLTYLYDFGDGWEHTLELEKITPLADRGKLPRCTTGARACPPEDVGGTPGYSRMLRILRTPSHGEYEETREWLGDNFDPNAFDKETINQELDTHRRQRQLIELFADMAEEMGTATGGEPPSDADIEVIKRYFPVGTSVTDRLPNYDALHGYLSAIICAPQPIMPVEWMSNLCGDYRLEFSSRQTFTPFMLALLRLYNQIARALYDERPILPQAEDLDKTPPGTTTTERWCDGFLRGFMLHEGDWFALEDDEKLEELEYALALLSALALREVDDTTLTGEVLHERIRIAEKYLPKVILDLYALARSKHYADDRDSYLPPPVQPPATSTRIGRNDPCPCGSGKKYKKCCIDKVVPLHGIRE